MTTKNDQLKRLIEAMVQKEVRQLLPQIVPTLIKEVMAGLIMQSPMPQPSGNSEKRRALQEISGLDYDEYPTMPVPRGPAAGMDRARMAELMGYGEYANGGRGSGITVDKIVTEHGTEIPIPASAIPDSLHQAFNKDYRSMLQSINDKTNRHHG